MTMLPEPTPHWDIYEEHLDEAAFLWEQWEKALVSAELGPTQARELEDRLLAHLDGLSLGGVPVAEELLRPALADEEEAPRVSAAAWALIAERDDFIEQVLALLENGTDAQRAGVRRALELSERGDLGARLSGLLSSQRPEARAAALEVLTFRREEPGTTLAGLLSDEDPGVRAAALRATRTAPRQLDQEFLLRALGEKEEPALRDEALETAAILGLRAAWRACQGALNGRRLASARSLALAGMGGEARELEQLRALLGDARTRADALWALGLSGRIAAAEACLPHLRDADKRVARFAAEAFCATTGLVLRDELLAEPEPEPEEPLPLEDEDLDASLVPTAEEALPLANPDAVEAWWRGARRNFALDGRYLYGKPFEAGWFLHVMQHAPMRRRHALAFELAVRTRGRFAPQTRDLLARQLRQMEAFRGLSGVRFTVPFANLLTSG